MQPREIVGTARAYTRVSSDDQRDNGVGMHEQTEELTRMYDYMLKPSGYKWGGFYADPAVSAGKTPFLQREAGARISRDSQRGDVILFSRLDRGFRIFADTLTVIRGWTERGVRVMCADLMGAQMDLSSPTGKIVLWAMGMVAELQYDGIIENAKRTIRQSRIDDRTVGGPDFGYAVHKAGKGKKYLYPDLLSRRIASWILEQSMMRVPVPAITKALNSMPEESVYARNPRTGHRWSEDAVGRWIKAERRLREREKEAGANLTTLFLMPSGKLRTFESFYAEQRHRMADWMTGAADQEIVHDEVLR